MTSTPISLRPRAYSRGLSRRSTIFSRISGSGFGFYTVLITLLAAVFCLSCGHATAKTIGRSGNTYQIAEPDSLKELEDKAASLDPAKVIDKKEAVRKIEKYRPHNAVSLPSAKDDKTFLVDMSYTLEVDIQDGKGNILYPKGFVLNPLEYVPFSRTIVVINGAVEKEVGWFTASEYSRRADVLVLVTGGTWKDLMGRFRRNVFYLTEPVAKRLRLSATPSVIVKKDNKYMEVREVHVPDKKDIAGRGN